MKPNKSERQMLGFTLFSPTYGTDQDDFNQHVDYIHWNPVKHGWVQRVVDWPHSSFHQFVALGLYPASWGYSGEFNINAHE